MLFLSIRRSLNVAARAGMAVGPRSAGAGALFGAQELVQHTEQASGAGYQPLVPAAARQVAEPSERQVVNQVRALAALARAPA